MIIAIVIGVSCLFWIIAAILFHNEELQDAGCREPFMYRY